jgi:hypothetical protein
MALGFAVVATVDGRIARLTNSCSEFGVQMDSLADVITFGLAPGSVGIPLGRQGDCATVPPREACAADWMDSLLRVCHLWCHAAGTL